MNGKTEDSSGARDNKNTRMSYEGRIADGAAGIWLNFFEGCDTRSTASFFMTRDEAKALITYINCLCDRIDWAEHLLQEEKFRRKNRRIEDFP